MTTKKKETKFLHSAISVFKFADCVIKCIFLSGDLLQQHCQQNFFLPENAQGSTISQTVQYLSKTVYLKAC